MVALRAVARVTCSEILREGMFSFVLVVAALLILFSQFLPFFGDAESEIKLVRDMGLATMVLAGGGLALLYAGSGIGEELESRMAAMVLSKPVGRGAFVLGKFLGTLQTVVFLWAVLGGTLLFSVWNEARHAREGTPPPFWDRGSLQGIVLAFAEVAVVCAVGIAASSFLPSVAAAGVAGGVFVAGHLSGTLAAREGTAGWLWGWFPDLSLLRVADALAMERLVPWSYVAAGGLYAALLAALFLTVACWRMDRRDVA